MNLTRANVADLLYCASSEANDETLLAALSGVENDVWYKLPVKVRQWYGRCVTAQKRGAKLPEFPSEEPSDSASKFQTSSVTHRIIELLVMKSDLSSKDLMGILDKEGFAPNTASIKSISAIVRHTLRVKEESQAGM